MSFTVFAVWCDPFVFKETSGLIGFKPFAATKFDVVSISVGCEMQDKLLLFGKLSLCRTVALHGFGSSVDLIEARKSPDQLLVFSKYEAGANPSFPLNL